MRTSTKSRFRSGPAKWAGLPRATLLRSERFTAGCARGSTWSKSTTGGSAFVVVPTRGMGIWRASCGDVQLGWKSPVKGPVHPALVPVTEPSGIGWLYGFDELLVRCGLESNGAPEFLPNGALLLPLHGRVANIPAHKVEVAIDGDSGEIAVTGAGRRGPLVRQQAPPDHHDPHARWLDGDDCQR